jgi:hypothetical protein
VLTTFDGFAGPTADASSEAARDANATTTDGAIATDGATTDAPSGSGDASTDAALDAAPVILSCNAPGLVAYWPMNEGSGTTVHDCKGGTDGMLGNDGGVTWGTRDGGGSLEMMGGGFVTFGTQPALEVSGQLTVAGFFRTDALPTSYASLFWDFANVKGYEVTFSSKGELYAQVGDGTNSDVVHFPGPVLGSWTHLAFVFVPGVSMTAFANGAMVATIPASVQAIVPSTGEQRIGSLFGSDWSGAISGVRIFSRALTQPEIAVLASQ